LVHVHIFKNAGTSVMEALARNFGEAFTSFEPTVDQGLLQAPEIADLFQRQPGLHAISSHRTTANLPAVKGRELLPLVLIRHPVARIRSMYQFYRRGDNQSAEEGLALSSSFDDWIHARTTAGRYRDITNGQLRFFAGAELRDESEMGKADIAAALAAAESVKYIGTVERVEETLAAWEYSLRQHHPQLDLSIGRSNSSPAAQTIAKLSPEIVSELSAMNDADLALHTLANEQLNQAIQAIPDWAAHISDFRRRCADRREMEVPDERPVQPEGVHLPLRGTDTADGTQAAEILRLELTNGRGVVTSLYDRGEPILFSVKVLWKAPVQRPMAAFTVFTPTGQTVLCMHSQRKSVPNPPAVVGQAATFTFNFKLGQLNNGIYRIDVSVNDGDEANHVRCTKLPGAAWFVIGPKLPSILPGLLVLDADCEVSVETDKAGN
jgi:hypothetical protein